MAGSHVDHNRWSVDKQDEPWFFLEVPADLCPTFVAGFLPGQYKNRFNLRAVCEILVDYVGSPIHFFLSSNILVIIPIHSEDPNQPTSTCGQRDRQMASVRDWSSHHKGWDPVAIPASIRSG